MRADNALDIREATRDAVRHMITALGVDHGLSREEAYMLCSVAGDLRMHEVVRCFWFNCEGDSETQLDIFRWTCQTMWYVLLS